MNQLNFRTWLKATRVLLPLGIGVLCGAIHGRLLQMVYRLIIPEPQVSLWPMIDYHDRLYQIFWASLFVGTAIGFCLSLRRFRE